MGNNKILIACFLCILCVASFLRIYNVVAVPPGLYVDEAAIGVNADAILHTGKDEWGVAHPLYFKSFGDYKMPLYIYATSAAMSVFGKTEFAIRLPSILSGIFTVVLLFFLVRDLLRLDKEEKNKQQFMLLPLFSMFVLAIIPWHIQFSRGGFEVNLALFLYIFATWLAVRFFLYKKDLLLIGSMLLYVATIYTYHSFRVISPLSVLIIITLLLMKRILFTKRVTAAFSLFFLLCTPVFLFSFSAEGSARFAQTSTFTEYPTHSFGEKMLLYPLIYLKNYLSFFSLDFLFSFGDGNGRHQIPNFGVLSRWQIPFIVIGLFSLIKKGNTKLLFVIGTLLVLAPTAGALTRPSPHSLRSLLLVIPFAVITGYGLFTLFTAKYRLRMGVICFSILLILYDFIFYWHFYTVHYPKVNLLDWGSANKELVLKTKAYASQFDLVIVDYNIPNIGIYYKFYNDGRVPQLVDNDWKRTAEMKDKKILYVRPNYAQVDKKDRVDVVYLPNSNHDIYGELWRVK